MIDNFKWTDIEPYDIVFCVEGTTASTILVDVAPAAGETKPWGSDTSWFHKRWLLLGDCAQMKNRYNPDTYPPPLNITRGCEFSLLTKAPGTDMPTEVVAVVREGRVVWVKA